MSEISMFRDLKIYLGIKKAVYTSMTEFYNLVKYFWEYMCSCISVCVCKQLY